MLRSGRRRQWNVKRKSALPRHKIHDFFGSLSHFRAWMVFFPICLEFRALTGRRHRLSWKKMGGIAKISWQILRWQISIQSIDQLEKMNALEILRLLLQFLVQKVETDLSYFKMNHLKKFYKEIILRMKGDSCNQNWVRRNVSKSETKTPLRKNSTMNLGSSSSTKKEEKNMQFKTALSVFTLAERGMTKKQPRPNTRPTQLDSWSSTLPQYTLWSKQREKMRWKKNSEKHERRIQTKLSLSWSDQSINQSIDRSP